MRKAFNFYKSYYDVYSELKTDKEKVAFIDALLNRQFNGVEPTDLKGMAKFAYVSQKEVIDKQIKGWQDKTGHTFSDPTEGGLTTPSQQEKGEEKEKVEYTRGFNAPTIEEVTEYCRQRDNGVDPNRWYDFYTGKGWMIGKNKMKDWKASVRTWEKPKQQKRTLPVEVLRACMSVPAMMQKKINEGWTREEIEKLYSEL